MSDRRSALPGMLAVTFLCGMISTFLVSLPAAQAQDGKTYVMKLSTATINDTQHEWLRRFAAAVEKDSGGRIKGEIYPASQLGSIPRQIEGVQFGSIQAWIGPPEFLVGVDERYEALSAPGLFTSQDQAVRVINDPAVNSMVLGWGANKGLAGIGLAPIGPSSIATRKPVRHLAELKGTKIRVLASPFQLEMIKRMDASPVAMTLADVLPGLQQGAIDAALATITVYTTMQYQDAAKYVVEPSERTTTRSLSSPCAVVRAQTAPSASYVSSSASAAGISASTALSCSNVSKWTRNRASVASIRSSIRGTGSP